MTDQYFLFINQYDNVRKMTKGLKRTNRILISDS